MHFTKNVLFLYITFVTCNHCKTVAGSGTPSVDAVTVIATDSTSANLSDHITVINNLGNNSVIKNKIHNSTITIDYGTSTELSNNVFNDIITSTVTDDDINEETWNITRSNITINIVKDVTNITTTVATVIENASTTTTTKFADDNTTSTTTVDKIILIPANVNDYDMKWNTTNGLNNATTNIIVNNVTTVVVPDDSVENEIPSETVNGKSIMFSAKLIVCILVTTVILFIIYKTIFCGILSCCEQCIRHDTP